MIIQLEGRPVHILNLCAIVMILFKFVTIYGINIYDNWVARKIWRKRRKIEKKQCTFVFKLS